MDTVQIGKYIQRKRKEAGMTQKDLADRLHLSAQAVSRWETGESLPDTGILPDLCEMLQTTADRLLNGGSAVLRSVRVIHPEDVIRGFEYFEEIGRCFGENCTFYTAMVDGINSTMNMDILAYLKDPASRDVMVTEVLVQAIMDGMTADMNEVRETIRNPKMINVIQEYLDRRS